METETALLAPLGHLGVLLSGRVLLLPEAVRHFAALGQQTQTALMCVRPVHARTTRPRPHQLPLHEEKHQSASEGEDDVLHCFCFN